MTACIFSEPLSTRWLLCFFHCLWAGPTFEDLVKNYPSNVDYDAQSLKEELGLPGTQFHNDTCAIRLSKAFVDSGRSGLFAGLVHQFVVRCF